MPIQTRPNYGISRIDQPEKKNHGFYVRITHRGNTKQKYFADKANGGKGKALAAAKDYRDGVVARLPKYKQEQAAARRRRVKKSGVTGVTHVVSKDEGGKVRYEYWQAAWTDDAGRRRTAKFSISRYGDAKALDQAIEARKEALSKFEDPSASSPTRDSSPRTKTKKAAASRRSRAAA